MRIIAKKLRHISDNDEVNARYGTFFSTTRCRQRGQAGEYEKRKCGEIAFAY
jgi:hypothetical protein